MTTEKELQKNKSAEIKKTFLTEESINNLKRLFEDEQSWIEHMKTLNVMRSLYLESIGGHDNLNMESPMFRLLKLTNKLIGCLLQGNYYFDDFGNCMKDGRIVEFHEITPYTIETPMPIPSNSQVLQ